jgi:hypothetical protein
MPAYQFVQLPHEPRPRDAPLRQRGRRQLARDKDRGGR